MAVFIDSPLTSAKGILPQLFVEGHVDAGEETVEVSVTIAGKKIGYAIPTYNDKFRVNVTPWILSQVNGSMTDEISIAIGTALYQTNYTIAEIEAKVTANIATKNLKCYTHNNLPITFDHSVVYQNQPVSGDFFAVSIPQNINSTGAESVLIRYIGGEEATVEVTELRGGATLYCNKTIVDSVWVPHMGRLFRPMECNGEAIRFYSESWGCYREIAVDPIKKTFAKIKDRGYLSSSRELHLGSSYGREGERSYKVLFQGTYEELEELLISAETKVFTYEYYYNGTWENCRVSGKAESDNYGNVTAELKIFVKKLKSTIL